ncbi:hypothetical protein Taro_043841 [Colocasia esculenta]|uniref:Myb-like domain-containing protein n=1 Tax=Colocasia esculenta TaxID=4460 RepID=A0A843WKE4_COLES|nr:hypothetical protein [Colocasia esculenta]
MSDHPPNSNPNPQPRSAALILPDHHHSPLPSPAGFLPHQAPNANTAPASPNSSTSQLPREYRKGNWTLHETLVLITAKRLDDERRARGTPDAKHQMHQAPPGQSPQNCRSAEQRWKWVENYCWNHQCFRSQNQCNDKWDNLLRDYKKVRDYESRRCSSSSSEGGSGGKVDDKKHNSLAPSYWTMEKHERKERNLPSNLVQDVFQALTDVLNRRNAHKAVVSNTTPLVPRPPPPPPPPLLPASATAPAPPSTLPSLQVQQQVATPTHAPAPLPPPLPPPPPPLLQQGQEQHRQPSVSEMSSSSETDENDREDSDAKRRKTRSLGSSVVRSASVLARALLACEERRDKRHRDLLELEERRLRVEEDRTEMNRQGLAGLIDAVNNLAGAVHALVSDHHRNENSR